MLAKDAIFEIVFARFFVCGVEEEVYINTRFVLGWDHKPQIAEIDFSLVL